LEHVAAIALPGMRPRTIMTAGISKIHAVTGWRLGYVVAPRDVSADIRTVHDYLTICAPTPLQHAAVVALQQPPAYFNELHAMYEQRRDRMIALLGRTGFVARQPDGAYYTMASYEDWRFDGDSEAFTRYLITEAGVAVVPGTAFYPGRRELGLGLVRFAFAKTLETLDEVERRLAACLRARR